MTDTMTENVLIGVVADFSNGEIRPASMPDGIDVTSGTPTGMPCTVALRAFAIKVIEESVYVQF
jgi:hypothetical protein